ncbi:MAG: carbon storage regulator CsrA [Thermoguttaceae bacterium]|nr:carbon storage regulator CsrA [Thermoguttaceae bacterium]MDW8038928.1 carbon storage regulator CsrA [Thermoguttaceae bacterium]
MLVLSRQRNQSIIIGDNIIITVVDIRGDKVRLGIEAPSEIPVHRKEVYEAIKRENLRAAQLDPADTHPLTESTSSQPPSPPNSSV